ncbi:transcriptional regulator, TetR family [Collimonas sp. OK242]|jgi:AcrR family transcriptional regulator|uniref:TetR/AcrR family transcriptional regulator n=1 Tax=Collimonas sp. OK242 TaxID=1798195 RepID=UPI000898EA49|nr:TetR/AcrR family transcriptional regulator [Collimonas sp. OK242]SDX07558.1 transcriptional regulator, TetR family [Collimonas sp. OK242]
MPISPIPQKSRREEYAGATHAALLDTAIEIFTDKGYQQTGIEVVARAARVTRGAFYHHFEDKRALFEAIVRLLQQQAAARLQESARMEKDTRGQLRAGAAAFLEICSEPSYRRLVIQEAPAVLGSALCREIGEAYPYGMLIAGLRELHRAGKFDVENVYLAARMIGAMICEASLLLEKSAEPDKFKAQANAIVDRAISAFSPDS